MAILITGGAGFIGSHLVDYYLNRQEKVIVVDDLSSGNKENVAAHFSNSNFTFFECDLLEWTELNDVLDECDTVIHLAAVVGMFNVLEHPLSTLQVNVAGTQRLLAAMAEQAQQPLLALASTSEVYGSRPGKMRETDKLSLEASNKLQASYPVSKLCNEVAAMTYHKSHGLPVIVMRLFNTVGARQSARYGMVLPRFIRQALENKPLTIFGDGLQTRSFCDVGNTCEIIHRLCQKDKAIGEIVNVGNDEETTILALAQRVKQLCQSSSEISFSPYASIYGEDYICIQNRRPDLAKLYSLIDFTPYKTLDEIIITMLHQKS